MFVGGFLSGAVTRKTFRAVRLGALERDLEPRRGDHRQAPNENCSGNVLNFSLAGHFRFGQISLESFRISPGWTLLVHPEIAPDVAQGFLKDYEKTLL